MGIIVSIGVVALIGTALFLYLRRGRKVQYVDDEIPSTVELNEEEVESVIEATFEVLEVEREKDEEFENKVTKISDEIKAMPNDDLAVYINEFLGISDYDNPIVCTSDKSKFDWESDLSEDS